ncbi:hypothetical protein E4P40_05860 [Blastococcus sp. CT_GayMR20]|uniref:nSTAND1 domain-containing NTPase n=1 Tax=Blastococcus sp. CT_GayMR20 TaxID=2559609 RepID=UPI0010748CB8|nr:BTAD domain-containing putative transcriptional regulator [Blastococcus sp. CT_GayMR20]TFV91552.1 hypothetical protein E4P40_05860 [Blastococcus sp. CT_GayMR20]
MRIAVLGPLEVSTDDGRPVTVPGAKERLLLAVLAASSPDVVSTDRIVETLWNGDRPASAQKSLQVYLVHLRTALEPERARGEAGHYVVRRGSGYALTTSAADVDALLVGELAARARGRLGAGDPGEAVRLASAGLALWRGEPYGDWPDASFADAERRRLTEVRTGAVTTLLEARLALGEDAEVVADAERVLTDDPLQEEWWRLLALALYRCGRQGDALAAVARARNVLAEELGVDPGPRLRAVEAAVLAQDPALDVPRPRPPPAVAVCPYKGLAAYQAADASLFHGRDRVVTQLVARLVDAPLVVVSGASGAGKSSLIRAGLVPALSAGALPGSERWRAVLVTPGRRPLDTLAELTGGRSGRPPVLLVCDQFEELWAPGASQADRTAFLDALLCLLDDRVVVRCVAVVRGDHVGRLAEHAGFVERLGSAMVLVPPLTDGELREVVEGPAAAVGLTADAELVDAVLSDIGGRPAALPLLSTALVGTWERRRGGQLTLAGYLEAGGVSGALARSAEAAFTGLDGKSQESARRLFLRLADADDGGALVRRPLPLTELDLDGAGRRAVVDAFVGRRLLSVDGDVLDVVHESLLSAWPRLARWLEDDAAGRAVRRHLVPAAREWERGGEPQDELYRGARLGAALDWAAGADGELAPVEQRFLTASKERSDAELTDARDRLHREVTARRRTRRLASGLAMVLVVALVATGLAVAAQRSAERSSELADRESLVADANRLAAMSTTVDTLDLRFLLAAQGFRLADTPESQDGLLAALAGQRRAVRAVPFPGGLRNAALGNGGQTLFIAGAQGLHAWDIDSAQLPRDLHLPADNFLAGGGLDVSPTGAVAAMVGGVQGESTWLRVIDADGRVRLELSGDEFGGALLDASFTGDGRLVDVIVAAPSDADGRSTWRLVQVDPDDGTRRDTGIAGSSGAVDEVFARFSPGNETALIGTGGDEVLLVDRASGNQVPLALSARDVWIDDYRALASGAAQLWADGAVTIYDRSGRVTQQLEAHDELVNDVVLAPDGTWAATVDTAGEIVLWDVDWAIGLWSQGQSLPRHGIGAFQAEATPDSSRLVTLSRDTAIVWDLRPDGGFGEPQPGIPGRWGANPPEVIEPGRLVVAATRPLGPNSSNFFLEPGPTTVGVAATFLDPRTGGVVDEIQVGETVAWSSLGASVAVSPDRRWVVVTSASAATVIDARTREVVEVIEMAPDGPDDPDGAGLLPVAVWSAAWSLDGARLLLGVERDAPAGTEDELPSGDIVVYDTATWTEVERVPLDVFPEDVDMDRDGRWLAVSTLNGNEVHILDAETLDLLDTVTLGLHDRLVHMSFSSDGHLLAGAGFRGGLHIIDTRTWRAREPVLISDLPLLQVEWLPDDRTVVVTAADGTVSVFDPERLLLRAGGLPASPGGEAGHTHVVPDPDDAIVVMNDQHAALRYPMDPAVWLETACAIVSRDLTRAEWERYLAGREYRATCSDLG